MLKQPPCPESICDLRREDPILRRASSVLMLRWLQAVPWEGNWETFAGAGRGAGSNSPTY